MEGREGNKYEDGLVERAIEGREGEACYRQPEGE
jgi:hypothetical protein